MAKAVKEKNVGKGKNTKKNKKVKKESFLVGIKKELKLVKWPSFKEIIKYTIATIIFCLVLIAFFEVLNIVLAFIKGLFN